MTFNTHFAMQNVKLTFLSWPTLPVLKTSIVRFNISKAKFAFSFKHLMIFFSLLYLNSDFTNSLPYASYFSLSRITVRCKFSARSQYLVRLLSLWWNTGGSTVYQPLEWLLPQTGFEPTPFQISIGLQVHATTPVKYFLKLASFWNSS